MDASSFPYFLWDILAFEEFFSMTCNLTQSFDGTKFFEMSFSNFPHHISQAHGETTCVLLPSNACISCAHYGETNH